MYAQLSKEYERTKNLLLELKRLSLQVTEYPGAYSNQPGTSGNPSHTRHCTTPTNTTGNGKHALDVIEEQESEVPAESGRTDSHTDNPPTQIDITVTSPERMECQIERLRVNSAHQRKCDQLLCKMVSARESLSKKLAELNVQDPEEVKTESKPPATETDNSAGTEPNGDKSFTEKKHDTLVVDQTTDTSSPVFPLTPNPLCH
ncbi:unnamed protein product [Echinostoma caproni]|uniref:GOLGA2L5 domain-containing protein n=1 Tax=Echinostoma caproni TaxID=27848 RepID=A0A183AQ61_9TREM|nr:unnamed protein product [Echinostoma caproni]